MKWVKDADDNLINMAYVEKIWIRYNKPNQHNKETYHVVGLMEGDTLEFSSEIETIFEAVQELDGLHKNLND